MRILGLDLGQSHDPAAAAVVDRVSSEPRDFIGPRNPCFLPRFHCRQLRLWPLGTDYTQLVNDVFDLHTDVIAVDFGGVGRPVVDMMRKKAMAIGYKGKIKPIQLIASSARVSKKQETRGAHWNVPKIDVVTSIIAAQQSKQLFLPDCAETLQLLEQLRQFQMKFTKSANLQFGNLPGGHDDLVIALGLAVWWAQRFGTMRPAIWV